MRIGVSLLFFLFWTPALLQDPIASSDPKFLCSYFHLRAFMWSFSGYQAPFWALSLSFYLKPQPNRFILDVVGGAGLQLRQRKDRVYIPYDLSNKVIEWKHKWFYVENQSRSFPSITPGPPIQWPEWNKKPADESQFSELLAWIAILRQNMLTGETVMFDWMKRRIQPLQARESLGFQYQGKLIRQDSRRKRSRMM